MTPTGVVTVPNIASLKGKDLECKLSINAKYSDYLNLKWVEFGSDLFTNPTSCQNSIEIYDGHTSSHHLVSKKCNSNIGPKIQINGGNATIRYNIKNYQSNKNFRLMYERGDYYLPS